MVGRKFLNTERLVCSLRSMKFVYSLVVRTTGEVLYVGQTSDVARRLLGHAKTIKRFGGRALVSCCILEVVESGDVLEIEEKWIDHFGKLGQARVNYENCGRELLFCPELNFTFRGMKHAAKYFGCVDATIAGRLASGGECHSHYTGELMHLKIVGQPARNTDSFDYAI